MSFRDSCCPQDAALHQCVLTCPVCHERLHCASTTLHCAHNYSFDVARDGYVNLLLRQRASDTIPMLLARRQFLAAGYYQPLSDALNTLIADQLCNQHGEKRILDVGCGEDYYLACLQRHGQGTIDAPFPLYGLDVSKAAVRLAAKQHKHICFFVADITQRIHPHT